MIAIRSIYLSGANPAPVCAAETRAECLYRHTSGLTAAGIVEKLILVMALRGESITPDSVIVDLRKNYPSPDYLVHALNSGSRIPPPVEALIELVPAVFAVVAHFLEVFNEDLLETMCAALVTH
jgi:hypothetical protein